MEAGARFDGGGPVGGARLLPSVTALTCSVGLRRVPPMSHLVWPHLHGGANLPMLPAIAIALVLALALSGWAARRLGTGRVVAWLLLANVGIILAVTLAPRSLALEPGSGGNPSCDLSRLGPASIATYLSFRDPHPERAPVHPAGGAHREPERSSAAQGVREWRRGLARLKSFRRSRSRSDVRAKAVTSSTTWQDSSSASCLGPSGGASVRPCSASSACDPGVGHDTVSPGLQSTTTAVPPRAAIESASPIASATFVRPAAHPPAHTGGCRSPVARRIPSSCTGLSAVRAARRRDAPYVCALPSMLAGSLRSASVGRSHPAQPGRWQRCHPSQKCPHPAGSACW